MDSPLLETNFCSLCTVLDLIINGFLQHMLLEVSTVYYKEAPEKTRRLH